MVKAPEESVLVPTLVPFTRTEAPDNPCPVADTTRPVIGRVCCACVTVEKRRRIKAKLNVHLARGNVLVPINQRVAFILQVIVLNYCTILCICHGIFFYTLQEPDAKDIWE